MTLIDEIFTIQFVGFVRVVSHRLLVVFLAKLSQIVIDIFTSR